jgi:6-pyruvoyltetrahydropterin/6-carboxytetrahydropterin synthase
MLTLSRVVRFAINPARPGEAADSPGSNGYGGSPPMRGLGRYYELVLTCRGQANSVTGYFLDIKVLDRAARSAAIGVIEAACQHRPTCDPTEVMAEFFPALSASLGGTLHRVRWRLTPTYSVEMSSDDLHHAVLRQRFEFAAAHRLHAAGLSDEQNRDTFGKCNNPSGHGHNYVLEPAVRVPIARAAASAHGAHATFGLPELEAVVDQVIMKTFDHTHLNVDTPHFDQSQGGLNPSVENIAKVFYDLLAPAISAGGRGASLASITVWETEKTSATYPG